MTPEGKVKQWLRELMKQRYGHLGFWHYCPPGSRFGQAGTMDDIWLIDHVFVAIETKSGEGSYEITPLQRKRLQTVHDAGGVAAQMIGKDGVRLLQIFEEIDRRRNAYHHGLRALQSSVN